MPSTQKSVRSAVVQAAPVIMNREATVEKTLTLVKEAASKRAQIIVFPEAFISAYPRGLTFGAVIGSRPMESREDWLRYYESSITVPGETTEILGQAAAEAKAFLVIGVIDKGGGR